MTVLQEESSAPALTTSILIVDDHASFAELLSLALGTEPDLCVLGTARTLDEAVSAAVRLRPAVVLMDIELGHESGLSASRAIRAAVPTAVVIVVSAHRDPRWVAKAASAGASGYAPKSGSLSEMLSVIRRAHHGGMLVAPSLARHPDQRPAASMAVRPLTQRECDVLALLADGVSPARIAQDLSISLNTCRGYLKAVYGKLEVRSGLEAVARARDLGLIEPSR
jgi:DNA-binding NarL/FixJ family response regulator